MIQAFSTNLAILIFYLVYFPWFFGEILRTNLFQHPKNHEDIKTKNIGSSILIGVIIFISIFTISLFTGYRINLKSNWFFYPAIGSLIFYLLYVIKILWIIIFPSVKDGNIIYDNDK